MFILHALRFVLFFFLLMSGLAVDCDFINIFFFVSDMCSSTYNTLTFIYFPGLCCICFTL